MWDALIAGVFALLGGFAGAWIGRFWKTKDSLARARQPWAEHVVADLEQVVIEIVASRPSVKRPVPPVSLQLVDGSALAMSYWIERRTDRLRYAVLEGDPTGSNSAANISAMLAFHMDTREMFAKWARGDLLRAKSRLMRDGRTIFQRPLRTRRQARRDGLTPRAGTPTP